MMRRSLLWLVNFEAVFMPALSPSMETGTVVEWKKKVGEFVKENDVFCTVQTDKAVVDYTNTFEPGYLAKIFVQNGESAAVAKTIAVMVDKEADVAHADEFRLEDGDEGTAAEESTAAPAAAAPAASAPAAAASPPAASSDTASEPPADVDVQAVFMPALSPSMETGTIVEWKKKVGDLVKENDIFCTVQTDKAVVDYTNTFDPGYLAKIYCQNGESGEVSKTIAVMVADAADIPKVANYVPVDAVGGGAAPAVAAAATPTAAAAAPKKATGASNVKRYGNSLEEAISASGPSVMRIAAGLDSAVLESITPSGKDGRFVKADFAGQPGFDYNDTNVNIKRKPSADFTSSPTMAALKNATAPAAPGKQGDIYNVVITAAKVKKPIDDTRVLRRLLSTMTIPKPKKAKTAA